LTIMISATGVISQQQLVGENRRTYWGAVVFQPPMPHPMLQLEQRFQPVLERFDRLAATGVKFLALAAFQKLPALPSMPSLQAGQLRGRLRQAFFFISTAINQSEIVGFRPGPVLGHWRSASRKPGTANSTIVPRHVPSLAGTPDSWASCELFHCWTSET
jgi:hypothetical protein